MEALLDASAQAGEGQKMYVTATAELNDRKLANAHNCPRGDHDKTAVRQRNCGHRDCVLAKLSALGALRLAVDPECYNAITVTCVRNDCP